MKQITHSMFNLLLIPFLGCQACQTQSNTNIEEKYPATEDRPNIILVMADDLGWGDVAYQGNPLVKTPHLDAMAREGIRFDRFYAAAPVCSPTRASCLTGRHPVRMGIPWADKGHLPAEEITLAEVLRDNGYATAHFGKWHVGTLTKTVRDGTRGGPAQAQHYAPPWENGFDRCFSTETMVPLYNPLVWGAGEFKIPEPSADYKYIMDRPVAKGETTGQAGVYPWYCSYWQGEGQQVTQGLAGDDSKIMMDQALAFMQEQVDSQQPFFSVIWFHTAHSPIAAGNTYRSYYPDLSMEEQHWYGCITAMDEQIGRLRKELSELEIEGNTLLWFCSDNGPSYIHNYNSAGPFKGKKGTLWEGGIRVPSLLVWPDKFKTLQTVETPVSTSDFYPTILNALNIEVQNQPPLDGENIMPLLEGKTDQRLHPIAFQSPLRSSNWESNPEQWQYALSGMPYKIYSGDGGKTYQLYDITQDPAETNDLAHEYPDIVQNMKQALDTWRISCDNSQKGKDYNFASEK